MKRLLLAPAIVLPFFLVSCTQLGGPGGPDGNRPTPPRDGSRAAPENRTEDGGASPKRSASSYWPERTQQRQVDTNTSAS